jgi:hypothetical protein
MTHDPLSRNPDIGAVSGYSDNHDPLCPEHGIDYGECFSKPFSDAFCQCALIEKVREDEREQAGLRLAQVGCRRHEDINQPCQIPFDKALAAACGDDL